MSDRQGAAMYEDVNFADNHSKTPTFKQINFLTTLFQLDEEKKVEVVSEFYKSAAENEIANASAEWLLNAGSSILFFVMFLSLLKQKSFELNFQLALAFLSLYWASRSSTGDTGSPCTWRMHIDW